MTDYNYRSFPLDADQETFDAFHGVACAGERAADGELVDAATGEAVALSSLWREGPLVLEFGSIT